MQDTYSPPPILLRAACLQPLRPPALATRDVEKIFLVIWEIPIGPSQLVPFSSRPSFLEIQGHFETKIDTLPRPETNSFRTPRRTAPRPSYKRSQPAKPRRTPRIHVQVRPISTAGSPLPCTTTAESPGMPLATPP